MASLASTDAEGTHSGIERTYTWMQEEIWVRNRGFGKEMVHLCDGQETLWEARERHLPARNMTDILDLLHVTPRLWQAAHLFCPEGSDEAEAFARARIVRVLRGEVAGGGAGGGGGGRPGGGGEGPRKTPAAGCGCPA